MLKFEVGEPFPLPMPQGEGVTFSVEPYTLMLVYHYDKPTEEELNEFREGPFRMAVTELKKVLFIVTQFGRMNWADVPYSTQLSERSKELPELSENHKGYSLDCFMVDADTHVLKAHRLVRLTPDFSRKFRSLLLDDMAKDFDPAAFDQAVKEVYRDYSTKELLKLSLIDMKTEK